MISKRVKQLFEFIDYLDSKTEYLLSKQPLVDELLALKNERDNLRPNENYKSKIAFDKVQKQLELKFDEFDLEISNPIKAKISDLDIIQSSLPITIFKASGDLLALKSTFTDADLQKIFEAKTKYLEFRQKTNFHYFMSLFFYDLDRELKDFFDFFKDVNHNEFIDFEAKKANNLSEAIQIFKQDGIVSFAMPNIPNENEQTRKEIENVVINLVEFAGVNEFDFTLYNNYANEAAQIFNRLINNVANTKTIDEINNWINDDIAFTCSTVATGFFNNVSYTKRNWESNYKQLKQLFLNKVGKYFTGLQSKNLNAGKPEPQDFTANEKALSYIFDLYAAGMQVPMNRDNTLKAREIEQIGQKQYNEKPNTFIKAVRYILNHDLNNENHLQNISLEWKAAVFSLSKNSEELTQYLNSKNLVRG